MASRSVLRSLTDLIRADPREFMRVATRWLPAEQVGVDEAINIYRLSGP
jgi:hypothetical protein